MPTLSEIVNCIEDFAAPSLQEKWDNTGWQVRPAAPGDECTGLMLCLDVTPQVVAEAVSEGCNLIVSHHPLIFKGLRQITGATPVERAVIAAIRAGMAVYSSHTALDSAAHGVSRRLGEMLGLVGMTVLSPGPSGPETGLGVVGNLPEPMESDRFVDLVKMAYGAPVVRRTDGTGAPVSRVALCSGSGGEFIPDAIAAGADAYITSDVRYHDFLDHGRDILIVDTGHFESEICTKSIFSAIVSEKFPNFALRLSTAECNPVRYV